MQDAAINWNQSNNKEECSSVALFLSVAYDIQN